jgi:hypothetical protein
MAKIHDLMRKEIEEIRGQIMLDHFETIRVMGWTEDDEDIYWIIFTKRSNLVLYTACGGFKKLKGRIPDKEYKNLEEVWGYNKLSYENCLDIIKSRNIDLR